MPSAETTINRLIIIACLAAVGFVCLIVWLLVTPSPDIVDSAAVEKRIQPLDKVVIDTTADIAQSGDTAVGEAAKAKEIFDSVCTACHTSGLAGAPRFGNAADWRDRITAGLEAMTQIAIKGRNAMPPKGGATNLTDDQIRETVKYMANSAGANFP